MKHKKYLGVITAALLAVSPVAASGVVGASQTTTVQAATTLTSDQLMQPYYNLHKPEIKLVKKTPYLTAYNGEKVSTLANKRITDISSTVGKIKSQRHFWVYETMDDGQPDLDFGLADYAKLKAGHNYVVAVSYDLRALSEDEKNYKVWGWQTATAHEMVFSTYEDLDSIGDGLTLFLPVRVNTNKPSSTTKVNKRGYVKVKKNKKVRTYTSTGKFTKKYVYGHKTYKLNRKKNIKGHGTYYKIYGKNQWIPSKYLKLR